MKKIFVVKRTDKIPAVDNYAGCVVICDTAEQARRVNPAYNKPWILFCEEHKLNISDKYNFRKFLFYPEDWKGEHPMWTDDLNSLEVTCIGTADPSYVEDEIVFGQFTM